MEFRNFHFQPNIIWWCRYKVQKPSFLISNVCISDNAYSVIILHFGGTTWETIQSGFSYRLYMKEEWMVEDNCMIILYCNTLKIDDSKILILNTQTCKILYSRLWLLLAVHCDKLSSSSKVNTNRLYYTLHVLLEYIMYDIRRCSYLLLTQWGIAWMRILHFQFKFSYYFPLLFESQYQKRTWKKSNF